MGIGVGAKVGSGVAGIGVGAIVGLGVSIGGIGISISSHPSDAH